ncbi:MAG: RNA 2',3'-cyclic phosphodiesterase [Candidatus Aminicenantia bacterium]
MMRLFVAIDLTPEIKNRLLQLIENLKKKKARVKWIIPNGMHLTIKFLGETSPEKLELIKEILAKISKKFKPFYLILKKTGYFPEKSKKPRVLWVGVEADPTLYALKKELEKEFHKIGYLEEAREFIPHLTLGRVKFPNEIESTIEELDRYKNSFFGEIRVKKIILFQSILKPEGAEYIPLAEFLIG